MAQVESSGTPAITSVPAATVPVFPLERKMRSAAKKSPPEPVIKSAVVMPLIVKSRGPCFEPAAPLPPVISTPWLKVPNGVADDNPAAEKGEPTGKTIDDGVAPRS